MGTGDGYTGGCRGGLYRVPHPAAKGGPRTSGAGPVGPARAGVGGFWDRNTTCSAAGSVPTPAGPGRSCQHALPGTSQNAASGPITARFQSIYYKVSQNRGVSPKSAQKACHSPYIQNGSKKSALEILRFPILAAFSHKELMGHFDAHPGH